MASHLNNHWESPKFNFKSPCQSDDWKVLYFRVLDNLEALDINTDEADDQHTGWHQLKVMFEGEDRQTLQSLVDNGTISPDALDAISITIKAEEHFGDFQAELLSNACQLPNEGIHALSIHICTIGAQCKFTQPKTQDMLKVMVLQHAVSYQEARGWIQLQDQSQLTYQSLLAHCKLLESQCDQYQKAKEMGQADLTTITTATTSASSIDANVLSTYSHCHNCGYFHPHISA